MLDKISGLFRRGGSAAKPVTAPRTTPPPPPPVDTAAVAARENRVADATRQLDANPSAADALRLAREDLPAELRCRALARVDDHAALRDIALHDKVARVRLAAAERLTAADDLETLRRDSNDKAVQRHARDALKTLRDAEKSAQETRARIAQVLSSMTQHAARAFEPLYDAKLDSLLTAWQPLATHASAEEQERFAELAALAQGTVQRHAADISARQQAIAAKQELIAACNELETVVTQLRREDLSTSLAAVTALHVTQETRWNEAASLTALDAPLEKRYRAARQVLDAWLTAAAELPRVSQDASVLLTAMAANAEPDGELLDDWQHTLDALQGRCHWPEGLLQPALIDELAQARKQLRQLEKARQLDRQQQLAQLRKRRHGLKRMIDEGQLRAATRTMTWLRKRIAELPPADAASELAALDAIAESLQRLHDWYEFASVPKKTELCERIEALPVLPANADAEAITGRADQVRELREQWNLLCAADPDADPELRARFNRTADAAYAPCAAWYAALHRQQDENLRKRAVLCEELAAYIATLDAPGTDWKAVEKHERDIRATWKSIEPVRWPDARVTQEKFSALIGDLRARLETVRGGNASRRDELIAQAVALQTQEPVESAINAAKRLQDTWKQVGFTDPREDRRQWLAFRTALDAVFARRDAARLAEREARDAAQAELARQQEEAAQQKQQEQQRREARDAQQREARRTEVDAALTVGREESRWLAGGSADLATQADLSALAEQLDALPKSALVTALKARIDRIQRDARPTAGEISNNTETLALLTLDLEIALDIPSPPALAATRLQRKVERLNAALRGGQRAEKEDPKTVQLNAWLQTGPVAPEQRGALETRIAAVIARL
jgi:exonuclease SbcC